MSKLFTGKSFLGQKSHWTIVSLDNCVIGQKSLGQLSPWTIVPWTIVATPKFLVTRRNFLSQENISGHRKKFLVSVRNSVSQATFNIIVLKFRRHDQMFLHKKLLSQITLFVNRNRFFVIERHLVYRMKIF